MEERERAQQSQGQDVGRPLSVPPGDHVEGDRRQGEAGTGEDTEDDHRADHGVGADRGRHPGQAEKERAVGRDGVEPHAMGRAPERARSQGVGRRGVRVHAVAHELAVGGVDEHVPAEQGRPDEQREHPDGHHDEDGTDVGAIRRPSGPDHGDPGADEQ